MRQFFYEYINWVLNRTFHLNPQHVQYTPYTPTVSTPTISTLQHSFSGVGVMHEKFIPSKNFQKIKPISYTRKSFPRKKSEKYFPEQKKGFIKVGSLKNSPKEKLIYKGKEYQ